MANLEVIALDATTPQLRAPGSGDAYAMPRPIVQAVGTLTTDVKLQDVTATWNNAAVAFTGYKVNITDTASAVGSLLMDLQVGGVSKIAVSKSGQLALGGLSNPMSWGYMWCEGTSWNFNAYASQLVSIDGQTKSLALSSDAFLRWSITASANARVYGLSIGMDAANTLAQRNGTNAQTRHLNLSYTSGSNYSRLEDVTTANNYQRKAAAAGTGALKPIVDSYYTSASDPTATDIPDGFSGVWKNSTSGTIKLWANNGGTFVSVALA